jgi:UDP-N-acetylglucosamine 2-epimerase (non-hydrolysing)
VQGDTTTALVGALAGFYHGIPVAHVEAGIRTGELYSPFPEEVNRRMIGTIASYNFAATARAKRALLMACLLEWNG